MSRLLPLLVLMGIAPSLYAQDAPSPDSVLIDRAEQLVDALLAGDTEAVAADFNAQMRAALSPEQLASLTPTLRAQLGAPTERLGTRIEAQPPNRTVIVTQAFEQAVADVRVTFDAEAQVAGLFVTPSTTPAGGEGAAEASALPPYADTTQYRAGEVTVDAGVGLPLGGTLLLPEAGESVPGVALVHGSGPSDRDATEGPNKPLRDLAVGFASEGIAALRYDKRTRVHPQAFVDTTYTVYEESIEDALAALDLLRQRPEVDPSRLFVVGHSLGGTLAPRIAQAAAERGMPLAGVVVLAGGARPLIEILEDQLAYLDEVVPEGAARRASVREEIAQIRVLTPEDADRTDVLFHAPPAYWLDLRAHPPAPIARSLDAPILVVQAGRDYNIPEADFATWSEALADQPTATLRHYPMLNHLLIPSEGRSTPADYRQPGFVDETLVRETAEWIRAK